MHIEYERVKQYNQHPNLNGLFNIVNWYAIGATKDGQTLLEDLGFQEIISLYDGERKGYKIRDIKQPIRLITKFINSMNLPDVDTKIEVDT